MQVYRMLFLSVLIFSSFKATYAQESSKEFKKHNNLYYCFGAGFSILRQLPSDVYFHSSNNLQVGIIYERAIQKRFSLISGFEFEKATYNFDGDLQFLANGGFNIIKAGTDKKYTGIRQFNIAIPAQIRYYFFKNIDSRNMFLQGGLRITQSLDFLGLGTSFYYRKNDENESIKLSDYIKQTSFQAELMLGFKGQFFKNFDLINSSTMGLMYQLNSTFKNNSTGFYPIHFTWRFMF